MASRRQVLGSAAALLAYCNCVGDASDTKVVARVKAEVEQDRRKDAEAKKRNLAASGQAASTKAAIFDERCKR